MAKFSVLREDPVVKSICLTLTALCLQYYLMFGLNAVISMLFMFCAGYYVFRGTYADENHLESFKHFTKIVASHLQPSPRLKIPLKVENERIYVPIEIDRASTSLLNRILASYVDKWYSNVSNNEEFPGQIRRCIQTAIRKLTRRLSEVDVNHFILSLPYKGASYHPALANRCAEMDYLRGISLRLMPILLEEADVHCRTTLLLLREVFAKTILATLSDSVCNPATINALLARFLAGDFYFPCGESEGGEEFTEFLADFGTEDDYLPCLGVKFHLDVILKDGDLRRVFYKFLQTNAAEKLLDFCTDVDSFNERILNPDLSAEEMDVLYKDAWDLYSVYFSPLSPNCVTFPNDIALRMQKILSKDASKLQSCTCLFEAYDYVYAILENRCRDFKNSPQFFRWLYGKYDKGGGDKDDPEAIEVITGKSKPNFGRKLGNKLNIIKDVLKPSNVLEGHPVWAEMAESLDASLAAEYGEDVFVISSEKNLTGCVVSIPTLSSRTEANGNKCHTIFGIHIQRGDTEWLVERRLTDFYDLDGKLTKFHGRLPVQLPPRRLLTTRLEKIQLYERYLNCLVKDENLQTSHLLYNFLTSLEEFESETDDGDVLGKKHRVQLPRKASSGSGGAPLTRKKERAQHLESFIKSFVVSSVDHKKISKEDPNPTNPKQTAAAAVAKYEWVDVNARKYKTSKQQSTRDTIYGDHFNISDATECVFEMEEPAGVPFDLCQHLIKTVSYIYDCPVYVTTIMLSIRSILGPIMDVILLRFAKKSLDKVCNTENIAYGIDCLQWLMFEKKWKLDSQGEDAKAAVVRNLEECKSRGDRLHPFYKAVYDSTQNSTRNKLFFYEVLDAVLLELCPEFSSVDVG